MILDNPPMVWAGPRAAPGRFGSSFWRSFCPPEAFGIARKVPKPAPGALLSGKYISKNAPKVGPEGSGWIF